MLVVPVMGFDARRAAVAGTIKPEAACPIETARERRFVYTVNVSLNVAPLPGVAARCYFESQ